jgi:hypothetical protein
MENFKGTKGKWISQYNGQYYDILRREDHKDGKALSIQVMLFAEDEGKSCKDFTDSNECKANALLISKAPEMLEMLEDILSGMRGENFEVTELEIKQLIKEATEL